MIAFRRQLAVLAAVAALGMGLTACSSTSPEEANAAFCSDLAELQTQTTKLQTMLREGSSTLEDARDQAREVSNAYDQVTESAQDVAGTTAAQLQAADAAFDKAIAAIPSDATVDQAKAAYTAAVLQYNAAVASAKSTVGC